MDWLSALSIFSPEWILFAVLIAAAIAFVWALLNTILGTDIHGAVIFVLALVVILLLKVEGWYDVVCVVQNILSSSRGVILWMH